MKHMFSAFPSGLPGAALLLLRGSAAVFLVAAPMTTPMQPWIAAAFDLLAVAVLVGVCTRIAAGLGAVGCMLLVWPAGSAPAVPFLTEAAAAAALAMIGPGAFSIDARLFGRRIIHLAE